MVQELGETSQEMMRADDKEVQAILNRRPKGHYWIVIAHKTTKMRMDTGQHVLMRLVKDYDNKPRPLLGTIILEVKDGDIIDHSINLHDMPVDWGLIVPKAGVISRPYVQVRPDIAKAYVYN